METSKTNTNLMKGFHKRLPNDPSPNAPGIKNVASSQHDEASAKAQPKPGPAQAWPKPDFRTFGNLGTWKSGNLGSKKIKKIQILKIQIRVAQNVGKVWISRKKSSWPHLGQFFPWTGKTQKIVVFAYVPWFGSRKSVVTQLLTMAQRG